MRYSWLNPKAFTGKSKISGLGIFAVKKIKKGEIVLVQGGRIYSFNDIQRKKMCIKNICFQIENDLLIGPEKLSEDFRRDGAFLMNHSCEPTCGIRGEIVFEALRDINAGEEITYDYAMTDTPIGHPKYNYGLMHCNCGAKGCRKIISDKDWKKPELQKRYKGHFSLYIEKMLNRNRRK